MTPTLTIEQLWNDLRTSSGPSRQRRVDSTHPLDLYADFEHPDRPGLVAVCHRAAADTRSMRALTIDQGVRADGRWSLRIVLNEPQLLPVFSALCRDIVSFTRAGVDESRLAGAIMGRIDRWRTLLERKTPGLGEPALRGLIGELLVLETELLAKLTPREAVSAWTGPSGAPQDFLLPSGVHLEVKTIGRDAGTARVNGLSQLDASTDPLILVAVRVETTGVAARGAVTAPVLVARLRQALIDAPDALVDFEAALASMGWHEDPSHDVFALRPLTIEAHDVTADFPRLIRASVPAGVVEADYSIVLPKHGRTLWQAEA